MIKKGIYRHYKGKLYEVTNCARHSEDESYFVVYKTCYGERSFWVRPLNLFNDDVLFNGKKVKRFSFVRS